MMVTVRKAELRDTEPLAKAGLAAWRRGIGPHVGPEAQARVTEGIFAVFIEGNLAEILVADIDGAAVGFAATEGGGNLLSDLWVSPDHEGRGAGRALLAAAGRVVRGRGYRAIVLEVMTSNDRALGLYRRQGYVVTWQGIRYDPALAIELHKTEMRKAL